MSGHSKWAQIKRQKGAADVKRGLTFTKLSNAITIAVKESGIADPSQNFKLRLAMDAARRANMPKDNIERAIQRAVGSREGNIEEVVYEGFAPGGVSVIIEVATDNPQRTTASIKNLFTKAGGSFAQPGAVSYQFSQIGKITVSKDEKSFEEIFLKAEESGAEDVEEKGDEFLIYTEASQVFRISEILLKSGFNVVKTELFRKPMNTIKIRNIDELAKINGFIEKLLNLDDVQKVYSNIEEDI